MADMGSWRGRRALITGAGGFIGSHLTERLVSLGATTRALVRYTSTGTRGWLDASPAGADVEYVAGDIGDPLVVERAMRGVDAVFHLAALIGIPYSYEAPSSYVRTNVEGTLTVLEAARRCGVRRVVHASTSEVYGTAVTVPIAESHPLHTQSPYSATKAAADMLATAFHRSFGLDVVIVRPFNTYGPRQSSRAVIPSIVVQAAAGRPIRLGHTTPTRDFTYVLDTIEGFVAAGDARDAAGHVINLGSGKEISIRELAGRIQRLMGTALPIEADAARNRPSASEVERLCADASRARALLNWAPHRTLDEGLTATIEWIRAHMDRYRSEVYGI
jgi:NAD dependent epimerase/dehydratase